MLRVCEVCVQVRRGRSTVHAWMVSACGRDVWLCVALLRVRSA